MNILENRKFTFDTCISEIAQFYFDLLIFCPVHMYEVVKSWFVSSRNNCVYKADIRPTMH